MISFYLEGKMNDRVLGDATTGRLLLDKEVADRLGQATQTLRNNRCKGIGIPYVKIGRSIRYRAEDVEAYIRAHRIDPESA